MADEIFEILEPGLGATLQDKGRSGWRTFGVPLSGSMDTHAADWANRLLDNPPGAAVLELLLQGAKLLTLQDCWLALTGAETEPGLPTWRAVHARQGQVIDFQVNRSGVWAYLAVEDGFAAESVLGSASTYARGGLGRALNRGDRLCRATGPDFALPAGVAGRTVHWQERRDYLHAPPLKVWPGPQWDLFTERDRKAFFSQPWTVTAQSDRVGYRFSGEALKTSAAQIISEPVLVGSVQIPENGLPIVTMRDGPTVGGYPKLGLVEAEDLNWLAQCRPGLSVKFTPAE